MLNCVIFDIAVAPLASISYYTTQYSLVIQAKIQYYQDSSHVSAFPTQESLLLFFNVRRGRTSHTKHHFVTWGVDLDISLFLDLEKDL